MAISLASNQTIPPDRFGVQIADISFGSKKSDPTIEETKPHRYKNISFNNGMIL
jgi:hypothetical protein